VRDRADGFAQDRLIAVYLQDESRRTGRHNGDGIRSMMRILPERQTGQFRDSI